MSAYRRPSRVCARCHRLRPHAAKGLCGTCYSYVHYPHESTGAGRGGPGVRRDAATLAARLEDYRVLRRERGLTVRQAVKQLGVCVRTGERYEARLRDRAQRGAA